MLHALNSRQNEAENVPWLRLPGMCCKALGGDPHQADPVAAAWILFNKAAHIMDSVEDRDELNSWSIESLPEVHTNLDGRAVAGSKNSSATGATLASAISSANSAAISAATGLYFTANLILHDLDARLADPAAAQQIRAEFLSRFLVMCSGQHLDLIQPNPTIEQYYKIASAKSGEFFAVACWAGGRLAADQFEVLAGLRQFGLQIGLIIQMLDDLKDLRELRIIPIANRADRLLRSLPVIYVLDVLPVSEKDRLISLFTEPQLTSEHEFEIHELIEGKGGTLYLLAELEGSRQLAEEGLAQAGIKNPQTSPLLSLLNQLCSLDPNGD